MAMHWDGAAWTALLATGAAPELFGSTGRFFRVVALTATRVVAAGFGSSQADSLVADHAPSGCGTRFRAVLGQDLGSRRSSTAATRGHGYLEDMRETAWANGATAMRA